MLSRECVQVCYGACRGRLHINIQLGGGPPYTLTYTLLPRHPPPHIPGPPSLQLSTLLLLVHLYFSFLHLISPFFSSACLSDPISFCGGLSFQNPAAFCCLTRRSDPKLPRTLHPPAICSVQIHSEASPSDPIPPSTLLFLSSFSSPGPHSGWHFLS